MGMPRFKVDKTGKKHRIFLQCSVPDCDAIIKEVKETDTVSVARAYYCEKHSDGTIKLNLPKRVPHGKN